MCGQFQKVKKAHGPANADSGETLARPFPLNPRSLKPSEHLSQYKIFHASPTILVMILTACPHLSTINHGRDGAVNNRVYLLPPRPVLSHHSLDPTTDEEMEHFQMSFLSTLFFSCCPLHRLSRRMAHGAHDRHDHQRPSPCEFSLSTHTY